MLLEINEPNYETMRKTSSRLFWSSILLGLLTPGILFVGMGFGGAGHGDWTVWEIGLISWAVALFLLFLSCVLGIRSWIGSRKPAYWVIPGILLFIVFGLLGLWGAQG